MQSERVLCSLLSVGVCVCGVGGVVAVSFSGAVFSVFSGVVSVML